MIIVESKAGRPLITQEGTYKMFEGPKEVKCGGVSVYNRPKKIIFEKLFPKTPSNWTQFQGNRHEPTLQIVRANPLNNAFAVLNTAQAVVDVASGGGSCADELAKEMPNAQIIGIDIAYDRDVFPTIIHTPNLLLLHESWDSLPDYPKANMIFSYFGAGYYGNYHTFVPSILRAATSGCVIALNESMQINPTYTAAGELYRRGCDVYTNRDHQSTLQTVIAFKK